MNHRQHTHLPMPCKWLSGIILWLLVAVGGEVCAQDIHFSQVDVNPILFNPAYSGFFDGTGRFGVVYRNQWASVTSPFQTMAATAEFALKKRRYHRDGFSAGIWAYADKEGTLSYGTNAVNAILSYYRAIGSQNNCFLSLGAEAGYGQSGFQVGGAQMTDPTEVIDNNSVGFPTFGAGIAWFYQPSDFFYVKAGLSGRNLNRPNISYLGFEDAYINPKFNAYFRAEWRAWPDVALLPLMAIQSQKNYTECVVGTDVKYYLSENGSQPTTFSAGLHYRLFDAIYMAFLLEYNAWLFSVLYDANISKLTPASKSVGALELSLVYRLNRQQNIRRKAMPCPII